MHGLTYSTYHTNPLIVTIYYVASKSTFISVLQHPKNMCTSWELWGIYIPFHYAIFFGLNGSPIEGHIVPCQHLPPAKILHVTDISCFTHSDYPIWGSVIHVHVLRVAKPLYRAVSLRVKRERARVTSHLGAQFRYTSRSGTLSGFASRRDVSPVKQGQWHQQISRQ